MTRNTPFQLAAGLCVLLAVYPIWFWYSAWVHWPAWTAFALTGGSLLVGTLAWIHRRWGFPLERRSLLLAGILSKAAGLLLGTGIWFGFRSILPTGAGSIVLGAIAGILYLIAWEMLRAQTETLLSVYAFILMCSAYFVGILLCIMMGSASFSAAGFMMLCATAGAFVLLRSLWQLRRTAEGRDTPRGFYGYNAALLGGFIVIGAVLTAVGGSLADGIFRLAAAIARYFQRLAMFVTALLFSDELIRPDNEQQSGTAPAGLPVWIGYVIEGVMLALVLFLLWRFRREFMDFLGQLAAGFVRTLRHLIGLKAAAPVPEEHPEYTDSVELLEETKAHRRIRRRDPLREARRRWRKTVDPREKYRAGYAVWLLEVQKRGAEFPQSAVPNRILEAASGIPDPALTGRMTEVYYRVRYGEHVPDAAELQELGKILRSFR